MTKYIIDFKDDVSPTDIQAYLDKIGASVVKTFVAFKNAFVVESVQQPPITDIIEHVINDEEHPVQLLGQIITMNNDAFLYTNTCDRTTQLSTSDPNQWWKIYSMEDVDLDQANIELPIKGKGATVYLVDSGIKKDHPEFEGADIQDLFSITTDFEDRKGHGTALASVIVGKTCGMTNATLKNVKLFDTQMPTKQSDMLAAFDAIFNDFATSNTTKLGIVNCSWAIARNSYIENKIQILIDEGIFVVCSAGNNGTVVENVTPAAMKDTIVLGAYNSDFKPCDFSNYSGTSIISVTSGESNSGQLTGWAPGQDIWSAALDGSYGNASGTSLSAAIHSAILASSLSGQIIDGEYSNGLFTSTSSKVLHFGKNNILDLSAEKYINSPNMVSTFLPVIGEMSWKKLHPEVEKSLLKSDETRPFLLKTNKFFMKYILNPAKVKSAELVTDLPSGITLNNRGELRGIVIANSDSTFTTQETQINVTNLDDSVTTLNFKFVIKNEDATNLPSPENDPAITYQLQATIDGCCPGGCTGAKGDYCYTDSTCYSYYSYLGCAQYDINGCCAYYVGDCQYIVGKTSVYCNCGASQVYFCGFY